MGRDELPSGAGTIVASDHKAIKITVRLNRTAFKWKRRKKVTARLNIRLLRDELVEAEFALEVGKEVDFVNFWFSNGIS